MKPKSTVADRETLLARLAELGIASTTVEHAAVFTVEQSQSLRERLPGAAPSESIGVSMLLLIHPGVRDPILGRRQGQAARAPYFTGKMGRIWQFGNASGDGQERGRISGW